MSKTPFVCLRNKDGRFLTLGLRSGPYTAWSERLADALKFKTEDELLEWCAVNKVSGGQVSYWR